MDIVVLRDENERLKEQLAQTQAALAESEEARRRLESIIVDVRRETFGAKSEKLRPDNTICRWRTWRSPRACSMPPRRRPRRSSRANPTMRLVRPIAIAVSCRLICQGWNGLSSRRARCARAAAARWRGSARM